jgi:hypothetical protein
MQFDTATTARYTEWHAAPFAWKEQPSRSAQINAWPGCCFCLDAALLPAAIRPRSR